MRKSLNLIVLLVTIMSSITSCGVMFGGSKFVGRIEAEDHPNAEIYVDGRKQGTGTSSELYSRNRPLVVELREEGCENQTITFQPVFRTGNFVLSVLTWGLIGLGVDLGTGAAYKPDHKRYTEITKVDLRYFDIKVPYENCETRSNI